MSKSIMEKAAETLIEQERREMEMELLRYERLKLEVEIKRLVLARLQREMATSEDSE